MKAMICTKYGSPDVLELREVEKPVPGDHEVLVKVHAASVTSSDCYVRGMALSPLYRLAARIALGFTKPRQPILGMVYAGEIEQVGREVSLFNNGDRVFGIDRFAFGAYAEYKTVPEAGMICAAPGNLTYEEAAALPYGGTLALAFLRGKVLCGQRVMIYGASGAVGTAAVQLAKYFGAEVTGVCGTSNVDLVKTLGASFVIDYMRDDPADGVSVFDLVFDAVGRKKRKGFQYRRVLAPKGKFLSVDAGKPKLRREDLALLKSLAERGKFKPVIDRRYPLTDIAQAHRYVDKGHKKGEVIMTIVRT